MLDFSVSFIITIINIFVLFLILRKILFKPVTKFMEARVQKVRDSIEQAEKDRTQAKLLLEQYEEKLRHAGEEAAALIRKAEEQAKFEADRMLAEGKETAERLVENTRKQLEAEQRAAMATFKAEAAALVVAAATRFLQREIRAEDSRHYAGLLLKEIGKD